MADVSGCLQLCGVGLRAYRPSPTLGYPDAMKPDACTCTSAAHRIALHHTMLHQSMLHHTAPHRAPHYTNITPHTTHAYCTTIMETPLPPYDLCLRTT